MAVIEQRYAQALTDLVARGDIDADKLRRELATLTQAVESSPALTTVLASPAVAWEKKLAVLDALVARLQLSRLTRNFLVVAAQRGRISLLAGIDRAFEQLRLQTQGIVKAQILSARELGQAERAAIERQLALSLGRKLETQYATDASLVGGFLARVGDQVYDGSIRGRLDRLRQNLLNN